jgi:hypothetical protein
VIVFWITPRVAISIGAASAALGLLALLAFV